MTNYFLKPIRGKVFRLTQLDSCGAPVHGPGATLVSKGFVKVDIKPQVEAGTDYKQKNANDELMINSRGKPFVRWCDITVDLLGVDPYAFSLTTGSPLVMNDAATPEAVGFSIRAQTTANFALELWTDLDGQVCGPGQPAQYGYFVIPFITDGVIGDVQVDNSVINFSIGGARTVLNSPWGVGPYNVLNKLTAPTGPAPLLAPIAPDEHYRPLMTTLAPPVHAVGAVALP